MGKMSEQEKEQRVKERYNKKIKQRIEHQQSVLDEREIDLEVAKKLEQDHKIERHKKEIENVKDRIEALKDQLEE